MEIRVEDWDVKGKLFYLRNTTTSLVIEANAAGYLFLKYFGKKIKKYREANRNEAIDRAFSPGPYAEDRTFSLDTRGLLYSHAGMGDFRYPAFELQNQLDNSSDFRFESYQVLTKKPEIAGLPASYGPSVQTLRLTCCDPQLQVKRHLYYSLFADSSVIATHVEFENYGDETIFIRKAASCMLDLPDADYQLVELAGAYAREKTMQKTPLKQGLMTVSSRRGASSHQATPMTCLARPDATEKAGEVITLQLLYSGDFEAGVFVDQLQTSRAFIGINPETFGWELTSKAVFKTPEALISYTDQGFGAMSRTSHAFINQHLLRGEYKNKLRPILLNNWEATYFDFNQEKILELADAAANVGVELLVLDDGWFGQRNDDNSSLGDWHINLEKLPGGLNELAREVNRRNLMFGIWVEPEMISVDSDLYRQHPDWCLGMRNRSHNFSRNQLVLDLTRADVRAYLIESLSQIFSSAHIQYVKWDMNRNMTNVASASADFHPKEISHRYMLGLYEILETLTTRFPEILFESCSGGGGRYDLGMLYYMPQTWTSDNTDAICRLNIQYGTSFLYPAITMGAHVSAVPNHQVGRSPNLATRGNIAMAGNLGYELDLTQLSAAELTEIREQIVQYKEIRSIIQQGELFRLLNPEKGQNEVGYLYVNDEKTAAVVTYCKILAEAESPVRILKLAGLNPAYLYEDAATGAVYGGDELMHVGLTIPLHKGDFYSLQYHFKAKE